jgi:hypothetical protein
MRSRQLYGWFDQRQQIFRVSAWPPDSPVRPSLAFDHKVEVDAFVARKRAKLLWCPLLHLHEERI